MSVGRVETTKIPSVKTTGTRLAPKGFRVDRYKNYITLHLALYIKLKSLIHGITDYGRAWVNSKNYCFSGSKAPYKQSLFSRYICFVPRKGSARIVSSFC